MVIAFVFSLGVGYQTLENRVDAADTATNARITAHETEGEKDLEYIIKDLGEIKQKSPTLNAISGRISNMDFVDRVIAVNKVVRR